MMIQPTREVGLNEMDNQLTDIAELPCEYWVSLGETIRYLESLYTRNGYGPSKTSERLDRLIACYEKGVNNG